MVMMNREIIIEKGSTAIQVLCDSSGNILGFPAINVFAFLKKNLTEYEFDFRKKRWTAKYKYFKYDKDNRILTIPVNTYSRFLSYINDSHGKYVVVDTPPNESDVVTLSNTDKFSDRDYQKDAIDFLISDKPMKALEMQTGRGKTYVAIRTMMELGKKTLIVLPAFLVSQWSESIAMMSNAKVCMLRGSKSIFNLFTNEFTDDADIYIASVNTLSNYALGNKHYEPLPPFSRFIERLKVGLKITDECHMNFFANTLIDIQCNIEHNIYLSATYMRSAASSNKIFNIVMPNEIRFGGGKYTKYVNITECEYSVGHINEKQINTKRGYSQFKYEKHVMNNSRKMTTLMQDVMLPLVHDYYIKLRKPKQKLLILVGLVDFAEMVSQWIINAYPELKCIVFVDKTDESVLEDSNTDIIISTIGSCGTGRDIEGLRTMILFTSFSSSTSTYQTIGRLRKMEDTPEFVYMVNRSVDPHVRHCRTRRSIYKDIGLNFRQISI